MRLDGLGFTFVQHMQGYVNEYPDPPITPRMLLESIMEQRAYPDGARDVFRNMSLYPCIRKSSYQPIYICEQIRKHVSESIRGSGRVVFGALEGFPDFSPTFDELQVHTISGPALLKEFVRWYVPLAKMQRWVASAANILRAAATPPKRTTSRPIPASAVLYHWPEAKSFFPEVRALKPSSSTCSNFRTNVKRDFEQAFTKEFREDSEVYLPMLMLYNRGGEPVLRQDSVGKYSLTAIE